MSTFDSVSLGDLPPGKLPPPRIPGKLIAICFGLVAALVLALVLGNSDDESPARVQPFLVPQLQPVPKSSTPRLALPAPEHAALDQWAERISERTQISARVLVGYARAEIRLREQRPSCRISWATLAGIGRVESHHGGFRGARVGPTGEVTKPIIGPPLDGSPGVKAIKDTEDGQLDGDPVWDRAVGPMQFLPVTWKTWAVRANGDGAPANPQNIDDAALAAARYLCDGRDLSNPRDWWGAVLTYNQSITYGQNVFSGAEAYAVASVTDPGNPGR